MVNGISTIDDVYLIPFKMFAWVNLVERLPSRISKSLSVPSKHGEMFLGKLLLLVAALG